MSEASPCSEFTKQIDDVGVAQPLLSAGASTRDGVARFGSPGTEHAATMSGATAKWAARWVGHGEVSSNFMAVSRVAS